MSSAGPSGHDEGVQPTQRTTPKPAPAEQAPPEQAPPEQAPPEHAPPERAPNQRTPSRDVEASLVRAADAVLRRDGLAGVTVRAVAAEAGVAPMGVYSRFGSKDGLLDVLLIRGFDGLRAAVAGRGEADAVERLRASGVRYREFALANRRYYEAMFVIAHERPASEEVAAHACAAFGELVAHVEFGIAAGTVRPGDPTETAQRIWSCVHGAVALELNGLVLTPDAESTFRALLDTIARGVAPGAGTPITPAGGATA